MGKYKNFLGRKRPDPELTLKDVAAMRSTFRRGDLLRIRTVVWSTGRDRRKVVDAMIEGVYPHGLLLAFWSCGYKTHRWISLVDLTIQRRNGAQVIEVGRGENEDGERRILRRWENGMD